MSATPLFSSGSQSQGSKGKLKVRGKSPESFQDYYTPSGLLRLPRKYQRYGRQPRKPAMAGKAVGASVQFVGWGKWCHHCCRGSAGVVGGSARGLGGSARGCGQPKKPAVTPSYEQLHLEHCHAERCPGLFVQHLGDVKRRPSPPCRGPRP